MKVLKVIYGSKSKNIKKPKFIKNEYLLLYNHLIIKIFQIIDLNS